MTSTLKKKLQRYSFPRSPVQAGSALQLIKRRIALHQFLPTIYSEDNLKADLAWPRITPNEKKAIDYIGDHYFPIATEEFLNKEILPYPVGIEIYNQSNRWLTLMGVITPESEFSTWIDAEYVEELLIDIKQDNSIWAAAIAQLQANPPKTLPDLIKASQKEVTHKLDNPFLQGEEDFNEQAGNFDPDELLLGYAWSKENLKQLTKLYQETETIQRATQKLQELSDEELIALLKIKL
jgi:hypothetical protein